MNKHLSTTDTLIAADRVATAAKILHMAARTRVPETRGALLAVARNIQAMEGIWPQVDRKAWRSSMMRKAERIFLDFCDRNPVIV